MEQIPLRLAVMCVDCNTICRIPQKFCPHCAGEQLTPIANWLSPAPDRPAPHEGWRPVRWKKIGVINGGRVHHVDQSAKSPDSRG
jgi:hypothetical protein